MTYQDKFVAEVKVNGRFLRVKNGSVYLPFGSEYSLYLKNLNSRRAAVRISIDGEDVLDNHTLILDANSSTELEGFLRGNVARNRFKFINKTKQISEHRGDRADDGLIRIEFAFEKPRPEPWIAKTIKEVHHHHHHDNAPIRWSYYDTPVWDKSRSIDDSTNDNVTYTACASGPAPQSISEVTMDSLESDPLVESMGIHPNVDEGITVKGSEVHQSFRYSSIGQLGEKAVIIISLKGLTGETNRPIQQPLTVQTKLQCRTCGTMSGSAAKYCSVCGTFLE